MKFSLSLLLVCFTALNSFAQYDLSKGFKAVDSSLTQANGLLTKADSLRMLTKEESIAHTAWEKLDGHINTLKAELKQYSDDDLKFPKHLFFERNEGKKLHVLLKQFQELALDKQPDSIAKKIKETLNLDVKGGKSWWKLHFENLPVVAAITMLSKIQNDLLTGMRLLWQ